MSEMALIALRNMGCPPHNDNPPFHVWVLSIGMQLGKMLAERKIPKTAILQAADRIANKNSIAEIKQLVGWL